MAANRDRWLAAIVPRITAEAVWLVGSLADGTADRWSDIDLLLVAGEPLIGDAVLTLDVPSNGPAGGGYLGAMYVVDDLPLWVDWYLWPAAAPIPGEARLLAGIGTPGALDLSATLDHVGRGAPGRPADLTTFALAMLPLAAKNLARGNLSAAGTLAALLGATPGSPLGPALYDVLGRLDADPSTVAVIRRHLNLVEETIGAARWTATNG
ncbi:nucleotidyltransferase domain-containing protein [Kribbella sandramycini]|uniref:Nucleotidyltransferase domain-containing protein n=1 Tax=Kribbella sandramycini TaxID=60450 RepID=A0A7Y4KY98_9ACTN|nr:nucleotidyltransferase domain-containing protein [Kribbella sandramycini]MBB6569277.1 hypothetical protein [Kribbella sandramycini]NOL40884.1 nucleotidyltransferase domain-containing protein [Kribbella sandramycini]